MSKPAQKVLARDGLIAREAGAWTKDKLYYIQRYAEAFAIAMHGKWEQLAYIDLLSGPGQCIIRDPREEVPGSPLRALAAQPGFDTFHFADNDPEHTAALRRRVGARGDVHVYDGDCNVVVEDIVKTFTRGTLALAFVDPEGLEVHFETLRTLSKHRVDIAYLFPSGIGLKRNIGQFMRTSGETMDRFWGGVEWRELPWARHAAGLPPSTEETTAAGKLRVGAFTAKVKAELGLLSTESAPIIANDGNAVMYHLLFFSKHQVALTIWNKLKLTEASGQRSFGF